MSSSITHKNQRFIPACPVQIELFNYAFNEIHAYISCDFGLGEFRCSRITNLINIMILKCYNITGMGGTAVADLSL